MATDFSSSSGRRDGHLIFKTGDCESVLPNIVTRRCDAENFYEDSFEVTETEKWLNSHSGFSMQKVIIAAYIRTVAAYPRLNHFIAGRKIYAHNSIEVVSSFRNYSGYDYGETVIKTDFEATDTVNDVSRKITNQINAINNSDRKTLLEETAEKLANKHRFFRTLLMLLYRLLDFFGWLPEKKLNASPFHGSMRVADFGELGIKPVTKRLANFGTLPLYISFGAVRTVTEIVGGNSIAERRYVDVRYSYDSRVIDNSDAARAFELIKSYVQNPQPLEFTPGKVYDDE